MCVLLLSGETRNYISAQKERSRLRDRSLLSEEPEASPSTGGFCGGSLSSRFSGGSLSVKGRVPTKSWERPSVGSKSPSPDKGWVGDEGVEVSTRVPSDSSDVVSSGDEW